MRGFAVNPTIVNRLNNNTAYWVALRQACKAYLYPSGVPTDPMDSVADVVIAELSTTVKRYTLDLPGGRSGEGTTSQVADLWLPDVTPVGKCFVYLGGHNFNNTWYNYYCPTDGSSVLRRMHDAGWHVVYVPMPAYDVNPIPQIVWLNGVPVEVPSNHPYSTGVGDGEPDPNRLYTDVPIQVVNSIIADYGITEFALAGHSGGGASTPLVAVCDDRYKIVRPMQGGTFGYLGAAVDFEQWTGNPLFKVACGGDAGKPGLGDGHPSIIAVSAAVAGRITVADYGTNDEYFGNGVYPGSTAKWQLLTEQMRTWLAPLGAEFELYLKEDLGPDGAYHSISVSQAAAVEAHLLANM